MPKEYWIVNGLYAFKSKDLAERFIINGPKIIEHTIVLTPEVKQEIIKNHEDTLNWLRNEAAFNKSGL